MDSKLCKQVNNFLWEKENTATEYVDYKKHPDFGNVQTQGECILEERKHSQLKLNLKSSCTFAIWLNLATLS